MRQAIVVQLPGVVARLLASVGDTVAVGDPICVIEVMKMEQHVVADVSGTLVALLVDEGDFVEAGITIAEVDRNA